MPGPYYNPTAPEIWLIQPLKNLQDGLARFRNGPGDFALRRCRSRRVATRFLQVVEGPDEPDEAGIVGDLGDPLVADEGDDDGEAAAEDRGEAGQTDEVSESNQTDQSDQVNQANEEARPAADGNGEDGGTDPAVDSSEPEKETPPPPAETRPAVQERAPARSMAMGSLPTALPGNAGTPFAESRTWPVVMRLITDLPLVAEVRRDGETEFQTAAWTEPEALPERGIRPGRAYGVQEGLVVYWGARDHFSLRLDRVVGVEVSINGVVRNISSLRPGQEIILDDHSAAEERR